ncbi:hypothetical protein IIA16_06135, partial [bacterium]|nr:hypothetical protein [bacterium]
EAEVDSLQDNLSRFSLFFPERRDFFLEGAGLFALGPRSASAFHSRRIGLAAGRPVPLRLGLKATGRAGAADLGILGAWVDGPEKEFFGVFRPQVDLTQNLRAGGIAIRRESTGADHTTLGTDIAWRDARAGGDSTQISLFAQTTEGATENGIAWGGEVGDRRGDWSWGGNWLRADAGYDPEVGFFPFRGYGGITQSSVRLRLDHDLGGALLRRTHKVEGSELRQTSGKLLERAMEVEPWSLSWRNGWNIQPSVRLSEARLDSPFTPGSLPAITIPAGNHEWVDGEVGWFGHFDDYTWVFGGRAGGGDWYDASRVFASGWVQWKATESLTVGPNWNWNRVERAGVEDTSFVGRLDLTYTPDAYRLAKITVQRDDAAGVWAGNLRLEWRPRDGEAIFLVAGFGQSDGEDTWNLLLKRQWLVD